MAKTRPRRGRSARLPQPATIWRSQLRAALLPRSGLGVIGPWLVCAPFGNPIIRLDLRLVDSLRVTRGRRASRAKVVIVCGDLEIEAGVVDGDAAARRLVRAAAPWSRRGARRERWPAPATRTAHESGARLIVVSSSSTGVVRAGDRLAGRVFPLSRDTMFIGRTDDNDLVLPHRSVSRRHARIVREQPDRYVITDLQSTNGVRVAGSEYGKVELRDGDRIDLGHVRLRFETDHELAWPPAEPPDRQRFIVVGNDPVVVAGNYITVGAVSFLIDQVANYALAGANLPLTGGRLLQAALAMLAVHLAQLPETHTRTARRRRRVI